MEIELCIQVDLLISKTKGVPFYYKDGEEIYDLSTIVVPEKYLRFVHMKGNHLVTYTRHFSDKHNIQAVESFRAAIPEGDASTEYLDRLHFYDEASDITTRWTEEDHAAFMEALDWFCAQPAPYSVSWCDDSIAEQ